MKTITVTIRSDVSCIVESKGMLVIDKSNSNSVFIGYPEAAVWYIITKYGIKQKSIGILSFIIGKDEHNTEIFVDQCLTDWTLAGLILIS